MMASFELAGAIGPIAKLRKLVVEFLDRGFLLLQQFGNESLFAFLEILFVSKNFFHVATPALIRHIA